MTANNLSMHTSFHIYISIYHTSILIYVSTVLMLMCWKQIDIAHASFRMFLGRQKLSYLCEQLILTELQKNPV